ncbi:MAG: M3 family oligoendopeptidase [Bacteroidales bacterium]|nr:M3 family oligoendopeptidase [Bacteroidales bacterium]MCF8456450.1 M3 family oligoendopeptidase [Bacteroidales bacterium]
MNNLKLKRKYLPERLLINSWNDIKGFFEELEKRKIASIDELKQWLADRSELDAVLDEDLAWRYINMNLDTGNSVLAESFNFFVTEIEPHISKKANKLDKKLAASKLADRVGEPGYAIMMRSIHNQIKLFRKENIPLFAQLQKEEQEYGLISSQMTVTYKGEEMTLQKAANFLRNTDRQIRQEVFQLMTERRMQDAEKLDELLDRLIAKRQELAKNAGYENFRDYKFDALDRFDYTQQDVLDFHEAIACEVKPLLENIHQSRKLTLGYTRLLPWDLSVDVNLKPALKPFENSSELIKKSIACFDRVKPEFAGFLDTMKKMKFLDLDSRKGKAPGGFNYPLHESNMPFIYMNATGNLRDMETMMHEGGHAIHTFLTNDLPMLYFKSTPSEVAELASMSMELISMEHWDVFFSSEDELKRARRSQLESVIEVLPWVATIDKFQQWLYLNPGHSHEERAKAWVDIAQEFGSSVVDWSGYEEAFSKSWQKQLHIYEVPFYYIEYAMSQLGAIAVWKNYKENPTKAIEQYENALKLGYTKTIPEIYEAAGIHFNFSISYVKELMAFVQSELEKCS